MDAPTPYTDTDRAALVRGLRFAVPAGLALWAAGAAMALLTR